MHIADNPLSIAAINQGLTMLPNIEELFMGDLGLRALPDVIFSLKHLKKLYLRSWGDKEVNNFSKEERAKIKKLLPNCEILFD